MDFCHENVGGDHVELDESEKGEHDLSDRLLGSFAISGLLLL